MQERYIHSFEYWFGVLIVPTVCYNPDCGFLFTRQLCNSTSWTPYLISINHLNAWAMASRVDCFLIVCTAHSTIRKKADIHLSYFMSGPPDNRRRLLRWDAGQEHHCVGSWPVRHSSKQYSQVSTLKGQCHEIFCFLFFSWISFPPAPEYHIRTVLNFFENSWRYAQAKVHHRYQRHRRQICHRYQRHRRQICRRCQRHRWQFATSINDAGGKFATSVNDTRGK